MSEINKRLKEIQKLLEERLENPREGTHREVLEDLEDFIGEVTQDLYNLIFDLETTKCIGERGRSSNVDIDNPQYFIKKSILKELLESGDRLPPIEHISLGDWGIFVTYKKQDAESE